MADIIQIRRDTAENWTKANPILAQGEFGFETDTLKLKVGDGATLWTSLRYYRSEDSYTAGDGISINDFIVSNTGVRSLATGSTNGTIKVNGTTDVSVKGLGTAAYTASNAYATAAQGTKADNAADKNLSNLTNTGANIANWSNNVTNCITEIPQDINLSVSSGHILLTSGSKVYFPNGSGVFEPYTLPSNLDSGDVSGITSDYFFFVNPTKTGIVGGQRANCYSGATEPTGANGVFWYDTTNNVVKRHNGSSWVSGYSLPFCVYGQNLVKKHIFNGFGFIGYTVFVLPGVKGLIPYYKNTDGTLKNTLANTTTVNVYDVLTPANNYIYQLAYNGGIAPFYTHMSYDETDNANLYSNGTRAAWGIIGHCLFSSGRISDFVVKLPFHAVDYNDTDFIAHQAMPSNKYFDFTLPDNSTGWVAPADGYIAVGKNSTASGQRLRLWNRGSISGTSLDLCSASIWSSGTQNLELTMFVSKGTTVIFIYSADGVTNYCRFIYANGTK